MTGITAPAGEEFLTILVSSNPTLSGNVATMDRFGQAAFMREVFSQ